MIEIERLLPKGVKVRQVSPSYNQEPTTGIKTFTRSEFFTLISLLEEVEEKSELMNEAGIDLYEFESLYLESIELLITKVFSSESLDLIHIFLYGVPLSIELSREFENNPNAFPTFDTVEKLWDEVVKIELNQDKNEPRNT